MNEVALEECQAWKDDVFPLVEDEEWEMLG